MAAEAEHEYRPSITKIWAKNFRSIEYAELELDPLTVLVGPNASGKSNLLDVVGFLGDAARHGLETAITRRGGIDSIGRRSHTGRVSGPEVGFRYEFPKATIEYGFALARPKRGEYRVKKEFANLESGDPDEGIYEIELTNGRLTLPNLKKLRRRTTSGGPEDEEMSDFFTSISRRLSENYGDQDLQLFSADRPSISALLDILMSSQNPAGDTLYYHLHHVLEHLQSDLAKVHLYHIFPNSLRDPQKVADSHPLGESGENLASTLRDMLQKGNRFLSDLKGALNYAVPGISDIRVSSAGSYYVVELNHTQDGRTQRGSWFDLSYESDGTIRLLAMLTALFQEPSPSLIGLEEPELAIHPGAMAVLADTMQEAALRGQVLVATHSPDLIDRLPIESIRAVTAEDGSTKAGKVAPHQLKSVREGLFLPGELHSMEGLQPAGSGE